MTRDEGRGAKNEATDAPSETSLHDPHPSALPSHGRLLALDWGERRIGLALSDETQVLASPLITVSRRPGKRLPMPALLAVVTEHQPAGIVVGLPLEPSGDEGTNSRAARELAGLMAARSGLPVCLHDERMSTARALGAIREQGGSTRGRRDDVDALAAAVILQHFLDSHRRAGGTDHIPE